MPKKYVVRSSQSLFERWAEICRSLESLKSIVQNDGAEVTDEELRDWNSMFNDRVDTLRGLKHSIITSITSGEIKSRG